MDDGIDRYLRIGRRDERVHTYITINASDRRANPLAQHIAILLFGELSNDRREIVDEARARRFR